MNEFKTNIRAILIETMGNQVSMDRIDDAANQIIEQEQRYRLKAEEKTKSILAKLDKLSQLQAC